MTRWLAVVLLLPISLSLMAGGHKAQSYIFTAHVEGSADEAPKFASPIKLGSEMRQYYFRRMPNITDKDVAYFYPFISKDGASFGAGFKLNRQGTDALNALSLTHQGKLLGIRVPNAPYTAVMIDRPIDDGVLVIWEGLSKAHLKAFERKFPLVEQVDPEGGGGAADTGPDQARDLLPR